jgi:chromosome partitioning protein
LTRYLQNRTQWAQRHSLKLPMPLSEVVLPSTFDNTAAAHADEQERFEAALGRMADQCDYVVIDCPGSAVRLAQLGHRAADTLVTPLNDSFVDFDLLAAIDSDSHRVGRPGIYAELVWTCRKERAARDGGSIDWIVLRNRMANLDAHNKRRVGQALQELSRRIGFRVGPGLSERVIYRELFPRGLTLLDLKEGDAVPLRLSHVAARQELRELMEALNLPVSGSGAAGSGGGKRLTRGIGP